MATHDDDWKRRREAWLDKLQQRIGTPSGNAQMGAEELAEEPSSEARQKAAQDEQVGRADVDAEPIRSEPVVGPVGYAAFEADFRDHHHRHAAGRRGHYEHYRVVYRYGYDLGTNARYRSADWASVEQEARSRWEERNPGTWEEFKETIQYAWDKARGSG